MWLFSQVLTDKYRSLTMQGPVTSLVTTTNQTSPEREPKKEESRIYLGWCVYICTELNIMSVDVGHM